MASSSLHFVSPGWYLWRWRDSQCNSIDPFFLVQDPEDKKPEGYDDIPKTIPDADAKKPDDWDDDEDGAWEPPQARC